MLILYSEYLILVHFFNFGKNTKIIPKALAKGKKVISFCIFNFVHFGIEITKKKHFFT
jgi:hypothetical protein